MYVYVENGNVINRHQQLPNSWGNIGGFKNASLDILLANGWYPLIEEYPPITFTQKHGECIYTIHDTHVEGVYEVVNRHVDEMIKDLENTLDSHLDNKAKEKRYTNRITCALRAGYNNPWRVEATAFAEWMDACNLYAYQVMNDCINNLRSIPTPDEFVIELPVFNWGE